MRWFLLPALALAIGGFIAATLGEDPGYVLIQVAGYTLESSLAGLILLTALGLLLIWAGGRLISGTVRLPGRVGGFLQERRLEHARKQLRLGLSQLAAGQWAKAEMELLRRVSDAEDPGTNYIYAATAAHRLDRPERRDEYLRLADASGGEHHAAVLLTQAQLWAEDEGRVEEAIAALDELLSDHPRHVAAQTLRLELLHKAGRWQAIKDSLPAARGVARTEVFDAAAVAAHRALLSQARSSGRLELLRSAWQAVDKRHRHNVELIGHYALLCQEMNADADGIRLIVAEMRTQWHPSLALIYGQLDGGDVVRQLAKVESWINQHGEKPELLLVAGRLCLRNRLWGRARSYFEACLRSYPSPEIRLELGKLLLQQGEDDKLALKLFREGLESSLAPRGASRQEFLPSPEPAPQTPSQVKTESPS